MSKSYVCIMRGMKITYIASRVNYVTGTDHAICVALSP